MGNRKIDENSDLKPRIIKDLEKKGFHIFDIGGTFDLFVDMGMGKGYFIELKIANKNYKAWADKSKVKGLNLTSQTSAIRRIKNLPIIFACDEDDKDKCYLILPKKLEELTEKRKEHNSILIGVKYLTRKSYNAALNELVEWITNK